MLLRDIMIYPIAPQSVVQNIVWMGTLHDIHLKRWQYFQKWGEKSWDSNEIDMILLEQRLNTLINQIPLDRIAFQTARREIAWWMSLSLNPNVWSDYQVNDELYSITEQALTSLERRIPVIFELSPNQIDFTPWGVWSPFALFGIMERWIQQAILKDPFIQKSLWLLTDTKTPIQTVMIYPYRKGNYKKTYKLHVIFADGHHELFILKWVQSYTHLLLHTPSSPYMLQEKAISLLLSDPDNPRLPTVGLWSPQELVIEQMLPIEEDRPGITTQQTLHVRKTKVSILELFVDLHLHMEQYAQPLHLGIGDTAFHNYFPIPIAMLLQWGRIDFGGMQLVRSTGLFISLLINTYIDQTTDFMNRHDHDQRYEEIEVEIIKILLMKGRSDYVENYLKEFEEAVQRISVSTPNELDSNTITRLKNLRKLVEEYHRLRSQESNADSIQKAA